MKKILLIILLLNYSIYAQVTFESHNISHNLSFPVVTVSGDMDGDGDIDIISGGQGSESIEWYENVDGAGNFNVSHFIADGFVHLFDIHLADLDGDNDLDVLSSSSSSNEVAWYENLDGQGNFGLKNIISDVEIGPFGIDAADLDGDNDIDVLISSDFGYFWHENLDGQGNFGTAFNIYEYGWLFGRIKAGDVDDDGDNDVVYSYSLGGIIFNSENLDGQGNFGNQIVIDNQNDYISWISLVDFDQDNDLDIIANDNVTSSSEPGGKIVWYSNTDGLGNFGSQQIIAEMEDKPSSIQPVDFDNDGDYDIVYTSVVTSNSDGSVSWIENLGNQNFGPVQTIINTFFKSPRSLSVADFDGDGDMDFVATSGTNNKVTWFENITPLAVAENKFLEFSIIPNPTTNTLNIICDKKIASIQIINSLGQLVLKFEHQKNVDVETLTPGVYYAKVIDVEGNEANKKVIKY